MRGAVANSPRIIQRHCTAFAVTDPIGHLGCVTQHGSASWSIAGDGSLDSCSTHFPIIGLRFTLDRMRRLGHGQIRTPFLKPQTPYTSSTGIRGFEAPV